MKSNKEKGMFLIILGIIVGVISYVFITYLFLIIFSLIASIKIFGISLLNILYFPSDIFSVSTFTINVLVPFIAIMIANKIGGIESAKIMCILFVLMASFLLVIPVINGNFEWTTAITCVYTLLTGIFVFKELKSNDKFLV